MPENTSTHESISRLLCAQTRWGRLRLNLRVHARRIGWLLVVNSTQFIKRALDIIGSLSALVVFSPVFIVAGLLVKLDGGPVFFGQRRVGLNGREFKMLKFRSMVVNAESRLGDLLALNEKASGITFKLRNDPRVTRIGRWLRKSSLDELPQLWNVLCGEMSLVGPRPALPREVELYSIEDRRRLLVKPGITCFWQVGERRGGWLEIGDRNAVDFPEQVSLDVRYIENQSLMRDVWLLAKTVPAILFGKGM